VCVVRKDLRGLFKKKVARNNIDLAIRAVAKKKKFKNILRRRDRIRTKGKSEKRKLHNICVPKMQNQ